MELHPITSTHHERAQRAARKWRALHPIRGPRKCHVVPGNVISPVREIPDGHCQGDRSCPFPPLREGRCRQHSRDMIAAASPVGTAHALMREYGLVEPEFRETRSERRCR